MSTLDEIVVRTALIDARKFLARGRSFEEAARLACVGAWRPFVDKVAQRLRDESGPPASSLHRFIADKAA